MANAINVQPKVLDLSLYAGDGFSVKFICKDNVGDPIDITGTVEAQIRVARDSPDPALEDFDADLSEAGSITLSLTGTQTQNLMEDPSVTKGKFTGVWDVQWTPSGALPRTLFQGKVECVSDVTR